LLFVNSKGEDDPVAAYDLLELGISHLASVLHSQIFPCQLHLDVVAGSSMNFSNPRV
jgi:hypothetical protein